MMFTITDPVQGWFHPWYIIVDVAFTGTELDAIRDNSMADDIIVRRDPVIKEYEEREELSPKLVKDADGNIHEERGSS
jgi:hypothetical protein